MGKKIAILIAALLVTAGCLFGLIKLFGALTADKGPGETTPVSLTDSLGLTEGNGEEPSSSEPVADVSHNVVPYENSVMKFTFDSELFIVQETPADDEHGFPLVSIIEIDGYEKTPVLPRIDIMVLSLENPFNSDMTNDEFEAFARTLIAQYYQSSERDSLAFDCVGTVVSIDEQTGTKMYTRTTVITESGNLNMSAQVRLVADNSHAIVSLALVPIGENAPAEFQEAFLSVAVK